MRDTNKRYDAMANFQRISKKFPENLTLLLVQNADS